MSSGYPCDAGCEIIGVRCIGNADDARRAGAVAGARQDGTAGLVFAPFVLRVVHEAVGAPPRILADAVVGRNRIVQDIALESVVHH